MEIADPLLQHWDSILEYVLALVAFGAYVMHFFWPKARYVKEVLKPINLLMILIGFSVIVAARQERNRVAQDVWLTDFIASNKMLKAERIANFNEVFRQLSVELGKSQSQVHVTSLRRQNAADMIKAYPRAAAWYHEIRAWPSQGINRRLYRVIGNGAPTA